MALHYLVPVTILGIICASSVTLMALMALLGVFQAPQILTISPKFTRTIAFAISSHSSVERWSVTGRLPCYPAIQIRDILQLLKYQVGRGLESIRIPGLQDKRPSSWWAYLEWSETHNREGHRICSPLRGGHRMSFFAIRMTVPFQDSPVPLTKREGEVFLSTRQIVGKSISFLR